MSKNCKIIDCSNMIRNLKYDYCLKCTEIIAKRDNLKICSYNRCRNFINNLDNNKCDECIEKYKKDRFKLLLKQKNKNLDLYCKNENCILKTKHEYCTKCFYDIHYQQYKLCSNYIRGCRILLDKNYSFSRCQDCLNTDRINDNKNRTNKKEICKDHKNNDTKICHQCIIEYDKNEFICDKTLNEFMRCLTCRNKERQFYEKNKCIHNIEKKKCKSCDTEGYLISLLRRRLNSSIKNYDKKKEQKTLEYLGCDLKTFREYFEKLFTNGMSWDKMGKEIHIDHRKPCASFNLSSEEEKIKCFHYTNLQPLWSSDNLSKSDKFNETTFQFEWIDNKWKKKNNNNKTNI